MRVHGINSYLKWTNNVLRKKKKKENRYRNFLKIGISTMEFVSSFSVARSANNVGKFRERVSNRFGTEDDDRGSLSPVSLATCKPNCVTWSGTETGTKLGNERSGRRYSAYSSAFCGWPTLQRSDVRLPFLKSSPGIRLHRRGYRAPCYAIGPRRDASNTASRLPPDIKRHGRAYFISFARFPAFRESNRNLRSDPPCSLRDEVVSEYPTTRRFSVPDRLESGSNDEVWKQISGKIIRSNFFNFRKKEYYFYIR